MSTGATTDAVAWSGLAEFYLNSAYAVFEQEHRTAGSFGLNQVRVSQPPIDLVDPAVPEYVVTRVDTGDVYARIDYGDGARRSRGYPPGSFLVVPPDAEARFQVEEAHDIAFVTIPAHAVNRLLDDSGLRTPHPFSRVYVTPRPAEVAISLLDVMWQASAQSGPSADRWLDGLTLQLLAVLADDLGLSPVAAASRQDVKVKSAIEYIETCLDSVLTIKVLAELVGGSEVHFSQAFKATSGKTVWAFVQGSRRARADHPVRASLDATRTTSEPVAASDRRLTRALEYIEVHLGAAWRVDDLVQIATMSRSGLAQAFRAAYGESVWLYAQGRRVMRAVAVLQKLAQPIAEVAELCGFASQSHLTNAMRICLGVTPGAVHNA